jgi:nucleotide-binding universal stress UspA family protein
MTGGRSEAPGPVIVVGVSGRTGSSLALRWAADLAARLGGRVRAVLAWRLPRPPAAPAVHPPAVPSTGVADPEKDAMERLERFVSEALGQDHGVECAVIHGGPAAVLLKAARDADLLVIDSPRPAKLAGGSGKTLAPRLIYRAPCPVVVMPATVAHRAGSGLREATGRFTAALARSAGTAGRAGLPPIPPA